MKLSELSSYRCPKCGLRLRITKKKLKNREIFEGKISDKNGHNFQIVDGFPIFLYPKKMHPLDLKSKLEYDSTYEKYDDGMDFFYSTLGLNGKKFDKSIVDLLDLNSSCKVLEIGAGTGGHTEIIAKIIDYKNTIFASDISIQMMKKLRSQISRKNISFSLINASALPFPDKMFDRVFHFGGLNNFGDLKKTFKEMTRVTKMGGKIVVGDEGIAPWLKNTEFGKMLTTSNPLFKNNIPIEHIPENARDVTIKHVANGTFYIIKYSIGKGLPYLNSEIEFPGERGGTYRTRYYGNLESVSPKIKELMKKAAKKSGKNYHQWLEEAILEKAKDLTKN